MITKKKVVLLATKRNSFWGKFEAVELIENVSQIRETWSNNKTPLLLTNSSEFTKITEYNTVLIPEELVDNIDAFTEFCHQKGFECGEYRTGRIFDTKHERCFMCELANHKGFKNLSQYNQFIDKPVDCIIYESKTFYVAPELGALKQGYLMIIPKEHILSVAQFPEEYREEYLEVSRDVENILKAAFNGTVVTFMEHGSGPSGKTSHKKSIVHAHTHVVVDFVLKQKYKDMVKLQPCNDISVAKDVHYFSYQEDADGQLMLVMDPQVYVQRQFPRQIMAEELGLAPDQYNWRWYEFNEITDATLFHLCRYLKTETNPRIRERTLGFITGFPKRIKKAALDD